MIWIGVDAHKRVHLAVALGEAGVVATRTIPNTPEAWAALLAWARQWPERIWAVEVPGTSAAAWPSTWPSGASGWTR